MGRYDLPDVRSATIRPLTEAELAERMAREGRQLRYAHGRWWRALKRGFYVPIHELARMTPDEARRPGPGWGFLAPLEERFRAQANAAMPFHLLTDVAGYGPELLPRDTRRGLRRLDERGVRFVAVNDVGIFEEQGYDVMMDWRRRKGWESRAPSRERFLSDVALRIDDPSGLVVAALDEDRLLGFLTTWAVDGTAYLEHHSVSTAAARMQMLAALFFHTVLVLQRSGLVREASPGPHEPEHASVSSYKVKEGYAVTMIPARLSLPWPVARYLRARRPLAYYRLTGRM